MNYGVDADAPNGCPDCGEPVVWADRWCEVCGAALSGPPPSVTDPGGVWTAAPDWSASPGPGGPDVRMDPWSGGPVPGQALCPGCGEPTGGADGWCNRCPRPWTPSRDHHEVVDGPVAAVTDVGSTHWRNEDAVGVRWVDGNPGGFALVVCDGVSVSQDPHLVSKVAVDSALQVLWEAVATGGDLGDAMIEATAAAQRAAAAVPYDPSRDVGPGACTFVATAVRGSLAAFGSVGDSRAYWVDAQGAVQIGRDDSLAAELIASGRFTTSQAMRRPDAHALTRWLGFDSTGAAPTVTVVELPGPGFVVLASDGLWNYAPTASAMASLIGPVGSETAIALARRLAGFANASGGADNITVAVGPHRIDRQEGR